MLRFFRFLVCSLNGAQGVPSGDVWAEKRSLAELTRTSPISRMAGVRSAPALARRSSARRTSRSSNSTRMVTPATGPSGGYQTNSAPSMASRSTPLASMIRGGGARRGAVGVASRRMAGIRERNGSFSHQ